MTELQKMANNCRKATFLIEKKQLVAINAREEMDLHFHLEGCSVCRLFQKQSLVINQMIQQAFHSTDNGELKLDNNFKIALQARIDERLNKI